MANIFPKRHRYGNWGGYKFEIYPNETLDKSKQNSQSVHIHVIQKGGSGNIRVFIQTKLLNIAVKYKGIEPHEYQKIIEFIREHMEFIKMRAKEELRKVGSGHLVI